MKWLSIMFAILCMLEATVLPACVKQSSVLEGQIASSVLNDTGHGCHDDAHGCNSSATSEDDGCGSVCSPFQCCGCCQVSFSQTLEIDGIVISSHTFITTEIMPVLHHCELPIRFPDLPKQPPRQG